MKICPSCRGPLNEKHAARHAKYVIAHRRAVRKKQREYAAGKGRCYHCGGPVVNYSKKCDRCAINSRKWQRKFTGYKPWDGSRGRPPIIPEQKVSS